MDEESMAIFYIVREEIYKALGPDVKVELLMSLGHRGKKRGGSRKHREGIDFYLLEGGHSDEKNNI
jgi:hypothetical protein